MDKRDPRSDEKRPRDFGLRESFAILFFGLACGGILIYQLGLRDYDALTLLFAVPVVMLATAKGFRYGALLSVICGAAFGTLVLLRILERPVGSGFIVHNIANLVVLVGFGFVLGIMAEYFRFGLSDQWRQETTIVETFVPDQETGLYNFKSFRWMLRGDLARLKRYGRPMSVIFLRIQNLAEFRRRHEELDELRLLREVGILLRRTVRESDYIGRYSDDEVSVALPETDQGGCRRLVERLRAERNVLVESLAARFKDTVFRLQISHATFPKDAKSMEELVGVVDGRYTDF